MSLDVYLTSPKRTKTGSGIYVREDGRTVEISRAEWDEKFPDREPVVVESDDDECYWANITHNLSRMANEAGLYYALWRPGQLKDPEKSALIEAQEEAGNYSGEGGAYEIAKTLPTVYARDLIPSMESGLAALKADPARFKALNPENGWGSYEGLVEFVEQYLAACKESPDAQVEVSR